MALLEPDLFILLRKYASLVPPNNSPFPVHLTPSTVHEFLIKSILLNPAFQIYPPSRQYQKTFWKWAIDRLEIGLVAEDGEIDSRIYEQYLSVLPSCEPPSVSIRPHHRGQTDPRVLPLQYPPSQSYVTHFWMPSVNHIDMQPIPSMIELSRYETTTLLESRTTIESGTTGLRTWLASFIFSQHLIYHPELIMNKRILELGSGIGFLGIIVASLQQLSDKPSALWLTDVNEDVLMKCCKNIQLPCNRSSSHNNVHYRLLDWSDALDPRMLHSLTAVFQDEINADLILGADIVFDPALIPALVGLLHLSLQPGPADSPKSALIALTIRNGDTVAQFLETSRRNLLRVYEVEVKSEAIVFLEVTEGSNARDNVKIFSITLQ